MIQSDFEKLRAKVLRHGGMPDAVVDQLFDLLDEIRVNRARMDDIERREALAKYRQCRCNTPPGE